jgi:hypothetical protein
MSLLDYFARAYVINLPDRVDRRREVERELLNAGMPLAPGKVELFPAIRPDGAGPFPSIGARGAFLSHLGVLKRARDEKLPNVLVLEDDVHLYPRLPKEAAEVARQLRAQPWDMVYLGHFQPTEDGPQVKLVRRIEGLTCLHCVGINGPLIPPLIDFLEALLQRPVGSPEGGPMHVDGAFSFYREKHPETVALLAAPSLAGQRSSRSDITPQWFDGIPLLRQAASLARAVRALTKGKQ